MRFKDRVSRLTDSQLKRVMSKIQAEKGTWRDETAREECLKTLAQEADARTSRKSRSPKPQVLRE